MIHRARAASPDFIGRKEELAFLQALLADTDGSRPRAVFVGGDAGVGKTRLVAEVCSAMREHGGRALVGGCPPVCEANLPFAPIAEALRPLTRNPAATGSDVRMPAEFSRGSWAVPAGGSPHAPPNLRLSTQSDLFEDLLRFLEEVAKETKTLFVVEDLHWADRSTLDLLTFLIRNAISANLVVLATYRTDELPPLHPLRPLLAELVHGRRVEAIDLRAFSRSEALHLLTSIRGGRPPAELAECVFQRTAGNPLFIEEIADTARKGLPSTLQDLLMARVRSVSNPAREILRVAAVSGRAIKYAVLSQVARMTDDAVSEALRESLDHHLLVPTEDGEAYAFRHPLLREAVYTDLLPGEKVRVHMALAETLSRHPELAEGTTATVAAELAYHWHGARSHVSALTASVYAGDTATEAYAFAEAAHQYERALELWDLVESADMVAGCDRGELMQRAAASVCLNGDPRRAVDLIEAAIAFSAREESSSKVALLYERLGAYLVDTGETKAALAAREKAVRFMPAEPATADLARVISSEARSLMMLYRFEESADRCFRALAIARAVGAKAEESHTLNTLGVGLLYSGRVDEGLHALADAKTLARALADPDAIERAYNNRGRVLQMCGRLTDSLAEFEEGITISQDLSLSSSTVAWLQYNYADVLFRLGRLQEVTELLPQVPVTVSGGGVVLGGIVTANLALVRGDYVDAIAFCSEADVTLEEDLECGASVAAVHAEALLSNGDVDTAVALVKEVLAKVAGTNEIFETARFVMVGMRVFAEAARQERICRPREGGSRLDRESRLLREEMSRLVDAVTPGTTGPIFPQVAACCATLEAEWTRFNGRSDPQAWEKALTLWDAIGHEVDACYACLRLAEAYASQGRRTEVAKPLRRSAQVAERIGAGRRLDEISALSQRVRIPLGRSADHGEGVRSLRRSQSHVLTAREVQVLRCLAQGMTDRDIAERLTISHKTAGAHVANIRKKLHVGSRVDAAAFAVELDDADID
jgi:DNA-binding CsgD family transcriptional regulator/tetratricopeptide (TPR) repeat protein